MQSEIYYTAVINMEINNRQLIYLFTDMIADLKDKNLVADDIKINQNNSWDNSILLTNQIEVTLKLHRTDINKEG